MDTVYLTVYLTVKTHCVYPCVYLHSHYVATLHIISQSHNSTLGQRNEGELNFFCGTHSFEEIPLKIHLS